MSGLPAWLQPLVQLLLHPVLTLGGSPLSAAEALAIVLALCMVGCNLRINPLAWPLAIASSALYGLVFLHARLYGQAALQAVYIAVAVWGWWQWRHGQAEGRPLVVRWLGIHGRLGVLAAVLLAWPLLALLLRAATDSPAPWMDALPTAASMAGQWLLGRKYVENWPVWVAVNAFSVALFVGQGLQATAVLYAVFLLLALAGWRTWARRAGRPPGAAVEAA